MKEWHVEGLYVPALGWEHLTTHDDQKSALAEAEVYDENEPGIPHRVRPYCFACGCTLPCPLHS